MFKNLLLLGFYLFELSWGAPNCAAPPPMNAYTQCCSGGKSRLDDATVKCVNSIKSNPPNVTRPELCFAECYLNETEIYLNGVLNIAKVTEALKTDTNPDSNYILMMETAFKTCDTKIKNVMSKIPQTSTPAQSKCGSYPSFLTACVSNEGLVNCPMTRWQNSTECNNIRDYLKACPSF